MRSTWRVWMALVLFAGLLPLLPVSVAVADNAIVAAPCGEAEFDSALATALTNGGRTITFACGGPATITFSGPKTIIAGNSVIIDGADLITLDGADATRLLLVEAGASLDLRDLTVSNGRASTGNGGAILNNGGTLTLTRSTFTGSSASNVGGAIYSYISMTTVVDCTFIDNSTGNVAGGLYSTGVTTVTNSTFTDNRARLGAAASVQGMATVTGSTFTDNVTHTSGFGGALYGNGDLVVTASTFTGNRSQSYGGAIFMSADPGDQLDVADSIFIDNESGSGGAIYNDLADGTIDNSQFIGNTATVNGGAINMNADEGETLDVSNSTFTDNVAGSGGAIYNDTAPTTIKNSQFNGNSSSQDGGAIVTSGSESFGVQSSSFQENVADSDGGAISIDGDTVSITDSAFSGNSTAVGGDGGAIEIKAGSVTISTSTFSSNTANSGDGGAIEVENASGAISSSTFSSNTAVDGDGGAVATDVAGSTISIVDSTITLNSVENGDGAGLSGSVGSLSIANTIVADNLGNDCTGAITSLGFNLDSDGTCSLGAGGDIPNGAADLGPLVDNGGPTLTHLPSLNSDAYENGGGCLPTDQRGKPRPSGDACDIGAVEIQHSTIALCANYYTGQLSSPFSGQCGAYQLELETPEDLPLSFCLNPWTGAVVYTFGGSCNPPRIAHVVPDDGDLLLCTNIFTGVNRWVYNHSQCTATELPSMIPAP